MTGTLHEDQYTYFYIYRSFLLVIRKVSDKRSRESQNTSLINFFVRKSWNNVEKYGRTGQAKDDNKAHAYCML